MILEQRTYTVDIHKLKAWLGIWETYALPIQREHIATFDGTFLGMFVADVGVLNEVMHLWQHQSLASREQMRAAIESDPRWAIYRREVDQLAPMLAMRSVILRPTAFSPQLLIRSTAGLDA
ncbi:NIPSNAP family protein [Paraburkholderia sediminicola]|uniref:NIPSNAP family protein n=1 Tax=Paraburkholderia metrosideri TaxID=580937 RepID=A0ABW9DVY1_9BURK